MSAILHVWCCFTRFWVTQKYFYEFKKEIILYEWWAIVVCWGAWGEGHDGGGDTHTADFWSSLLGDTKRQYWV